MSGKQAQVIQSRSNEDLIRPTPDYTDQILPYISSRR